MILRRKSKNKTEKEPWTDDLEQETESFSSEEEEQPETAYRPEEPAEADTASPYREIRMEGGSTEEEEYTAENTEPSAEELKISAKEEAAEEEDAETEDTETKDTKQNENNEEESPKKKSFWKRFSVFTRLSLILLLASILMALVFYFLHQPLSLAAAAVQIILLAAALIFNKKKPKSIPKWINRITLLLLAVLILAGNLTLTVRKATHSRSIAARNAERQQDSSSLQENILMPLGTEECLGKEYSSIYRQLKDAGFTNVDCLPVEDLSYEETSKAGTVASVLIGDDNVFLKDQEYDKASSIVIRYHDFRKCTLDLNVDFDGNFLFNKYDVDLYLNGSLKTTLAHGEDSSIRFQEKPGNCVLRFEKSGDADIYGEYALDLETDTQLEIRISCEKDSVSVKVQTQKELEQEQDDPVSSSGSHDPSAGNDPTSDKPDSTKSENPAP